MDKRHWNLARHTIMICSRLRNCRRVAHARQSFSCNERALTLSPRLSLHHHRELARYSSFMTRPETCSLRL